MPSVKGEFRIQGKGVKRSFTYQFECLYEKNGGPSCVMVNKADMYGMINFYIACEKTFIEIWTPGLSGLSKYNRGLVQRIPYSEITILWCKYEGIQQKEAAVR